MLYVVMSFLLAEACYENSVVEWRVRKLIGYTDMFDAADPDHFKPPDRLAFRSLCLDDTAFEPDLGPPLAAQFCERNRTPYTMQAATASEQSSLAAKKDDDYVLVDEICDEISMQKFYAPAPPVPTPPVAAARSAASPLTTLRQARRRDQRPQTKYSYRTYEKLNAPLARPCRATGEDHSRVFVPSGLRSQAPRALGGLAGVPMMRLNIAILAVGTRGDIQPFVLLGKKLLKHGHRVRLATHECFRSFVTSAKVGLEFYPLGGDPVKLSEFMVKSQGKPCKLPRAQGAINPRRYKTQPSGV